MDTEMLSHWDSIEARIDCGGDSRTELEKKINLMWIPVSVNKSDGNYAESE